MKNLTLILFTVLLTSCGLKIERKDVLKIHPEFSQYVKRFENIGNTKIKNLEFTFGETAFLNRSDFTVLGYCQQGRVETQKNFVTEIVEVRKIVINPHLWANLPIKDKELLAFHELGHCVLGRGHKNDFFGGRPSSIMHSFHNEVSPRYASLYSNYMQELFNQKNLIAKWDSSFYDIASGLYEDSVIESQASFENFKGFEEVVPHESEMIEDGCIHDFGKIVSVENEEVSE